MIRLRSSKSKTFLTFCFCFLAGVALASYINKRFDLVYLYTSLFITISFLIIFWKNKQSRFIFIALLIIATGFFRYSLSLTEVKIPEGKKSIAGYVSAEPDIRSDGIRYIVKTKDIEGKIYFKSGLYPRYRYGDKLDLTCKLKVPEPIEDFRYDMYLARFGVSAICQDPKIDKVGSGEGNPVLATTLELKRVFAKRINKLWHEPYAGFMSGLLYGYRGGLGSLNELFNITGVTHIIAISGYNISIVAAILISICVSFRIPRKKAFWLIAVGIALFVVFAGMSGSVVRAGIMGVLVLLAKQVGRQNRVANVMALTAVLMTLHNPFVLVWDAGFQLSFIATIGLVYLAPAIEKYFKIFPEVFGIKESLVSTFAAIIATLPLILFQFGRLSTVAPLVNVLILWLLPWIMLFGFSSVFMTFVYYPIGEIIAWIAWLGMKYITFVVEWFAGLPFAAVDFRIPFWLMVGGYIWMIFVIKSRIRISR